MSTNDKMAQSPLLYITQPRDVRVQASMQEYSVYKKKTQNQKKDPEQGEEKVSGEEAETKLEDKKFRDMTVEEKISYLTRLPSQMPKMKCEVLTEDQRYRGLIQDFNDDTIRMRTVQKPYRVELSLSDIEDVKLMGF
ncbi:hypothetical protein GCM10008986_17760 [Salinibacillus aidingensis]|uniref:Spore coat protein CotO n=1 Tax=Salinibacillus aidingensis TaxID=237684 RepID=A0ABN1B7J2_9BACI